MQSDEEMMRKAAKRADDKIGFYIHFSIYAVMNLFFFFIWLFTKNDGDSFPWFVFPLVAWGIGIIAHFLGVFAGGSFRDKLTEKEYSKLKKRNR